MGLERCPRGIRSAASSTEVLSAHTASKAESQDAAALLPAGRLIFVPEQQLEGAIGALRSACKKELWAIPPIFRAPPVGEGLARLHGFSPAMRALERP